MVDFNFREKCDPLRLLTPGDDLVSQRSGQKIGISFIPKFVTTASGAVEYLETFVSIASLQ